MYEYVCFRLRALPQKVAYERRKPSGRDIGALWNAGTKLAEGVFIPADDGIGLDSESLGDPFDHAEIAEYYGMGENQVRSRLSKTAKRLGKYLEEMCENEKL